MPLRLRLANSWSSGTCSGAGALLSFLSPTESLCLFGTCSNAGLVTRLRVGESRVLCGDSGAWSQESAAKPGFCPYKSQVTPVPFLNSNLDGRFFCLSRFSFCIPKMLRTSAPLSPHRTLLSPTRRRCVEPSTGACPEET